MTIRLTNFVPLSWKFSFSSSFSFLSSLPSLFFLLFFSLWKLLVLQTSFLDFIWIHFEDTFSTIFESSFSSLSLFLPRILFLLSWRRSEEERKEGRKEGNVIWFNGCIYRYPFPSPSSIRFISFSLHPLLQYPFSLSLSFFLPFSFSLFFHSGLTT